MKSKSINILIGKFVVPIPYKVVSFYVDRYINSEIELFPFQDSWIENMSVDVAQYLRGDKSFKNFRYFQYCNSKGEVIWKERYSTKLKWAKET